MNNWRRFRRLSGAERRLLLQALLFLPPMALALRLAGFRRCQALLARRTSAGASRSASSTENALEQARSTARMVEAAARHGLVRANCLQRSLTLWWLLRRQGIESQLRIGTRRAGEQLEAHAWVELAGVTLNDSEDVHRRFPPFSGAIVPPDR